jgi:hypothetical protein
MARGKSPAATHVPRWLRFVLVLWTIALLLLALQAVELGLFSLLTG